MRILIINGSPHKGNTWRLTEKVKEQIQDFDIFNFMYRNIREG